MRFATAQEAIDYARAEGWTVYPTRWVGFRMITTGRTPSGVAVSLKKVGQSYRFREI